jgi:allantoin racemase
MSIRLWHQSTTELQSAPYRDILLRRARQLVSPGTVVDLHGVAPGTWPAGDAKRGVYECPYTNMMIQVQCARNVIEAEDTGYDAFVYTCFEDPGLREGRSMVDIPVVGMLETSVLVGTTMGRTLALIGTTPSQADRVGNVARQNNLDERVVFVGGTEPLGPGLIDGGNDGGKRATAEFERVARLAIAAGADVLIPAEGIINVLLADLGVKDVDGFPVVDSWSAVLGYAEMAVRLHRKTGQTPSRKLHYGKVDRQVAKHIAQHTATAIAR